MADLTTRAEVKEALKLTGTTDDAFIDDLIAACTPFCQAITGYTLVNDAAHVRVLDGEGFDVIDLRERPVNSVTSVWEDFERVWGSDTLLTAGTDYYLDARNGLLYRANGLPWIDWPQSIKVQMNVGYSTIPKDLERAAIEIVSIAWRLRTRAGIASTSSPDSAVYYRNEEIVARAKTLLWKYSRFRGVA